MSIPRLSSWIFAVLTAVVVVLPFQAQLRRDTAWFAVEVTAAADHAGHIQLYFDRGRGFNESDSSLLTLRAGAEPSAYRLALPRGEYSHLRLDPTDRDGTIQLVSLRVVDHAGRLVRLLPLSLVRAGGDIQALHPNARGLQVVVTPGTDDPNLYLDLAPPLVLRVAWAHLLWPYLRSAAAVFLTLLLLCWGLERSGRFRTALPRWWRHGRDRPHQSVLIVAGLAALLSSYPVILLGKSFVSPNLGTQLLYDEFPTLPQYSDSAAINAQGSDVGAIMWQQVPYSAVQHRSIFWHFELPLWNRNNAGGTPLVGQGQSMLGDPLHLLVIAAGGAAWAWDLKYLAAKWLLAAGLGLSVWSITRHRGAAALTALAAPFCGFFLYRLNHPAFFSFCYAPWILWAWLRLANAVRLRAAAGGIAAVVGANWMVLTSGTVKEAFALLFMLNVCGVAVLAGSAGSWAQRGRRAGAALGAGLLFIGLSSPLWFTFWDTLRMAMTTSDTPLVWQIQPSLLLGFFDEAFYRPLTPGNAVFNPGANFLILAGVLYLAATIRESAQSRPLWGVLLGAGLSAALVFGAIPPLLIRQVPFLANIHHIDNSLSCALILFCAVLAGAGYAAAERRLRRPAGGGDLVIGGFILLAIVGAYVGFIDAAHRSVFGSIYPTMTVWGPGQSLPLDPFVLGYLASLTLALLAGAWLVRRVLRTGAATPGQALSLALCAAVLLWRSGQLSGGLGWPAFSYRPGPRVNFSARSSAEKTVEKSARASPIRAVGLQGNFVPGWTAYYGVETISGPDAVSNRYYREFTDAAGLPRIWDWRIYLTRDSLRAARPALDLLNVKHYLDLRSDQGALGATLQLDQLSDLDVYESLTVWPRAFFTDRVATYRQPADFAALLRRGEAGPFAAIQEGEPGAELLSALVASGPTHGGQRVPTRAVPASAYRLTENSTAFSVDAPRPGVAVLTETYWDGYPHASVDGQAAPVVRINHAFLGVPVAAGAHRVEIRYRPRYFNVTLLIAAVSAFLLALSGFLACRADPITD